MLSEGRQYIQIAPHVAAFPGAAILVLVLGFNLFGDGLRDVLDPSLRSL
jgi:peptide/nickel transport system permease protein